MKKTRFLRGLNFIAVLWIILSTGSMYFCIFNMKMSMIVLDIIALTYLIIDTRIGKKQFTTALGIIAFVFLNSVINVEYLDINEDVVILLMRLFALMIILSRISAEEFKENYCKILCFLCILSLICFAISELGIALPGQKEFWFKNKYYICTFYHTVGRWKIFHRNAGIFWEAPAFGIFINIAIMFALVGNYNIEQKRKTRYFIIYSITIFTTLATTVYLAYIFCVLAIFLNSRRNRRIVEQSGNDSSQSSQFQKLFFVIVILGLVAFFIYFESTTHIMENKLINREGSYGTRFNDTLMALQLALERPLSGYGLFNTYTPSKLVELGVTDNSNSFSSAFMYFGCMAFAYFGLLGYRLRKLFDCHLLSYLCIFAAVIVMLNAELIMVMTLFVLLLFPISTINHDKS